MIPLTVSDAEFRKTIKTMTPEQVASEAEEIVKQISVLRDRIDSLTCHHPTMRYCTQCNALNFDSPCWGCFESGPLE